MIEYWIYNKNTLLNLNFLNFKIYRKTSLLVPFFRNYLTLVLKVESSGIKHVVIPEKISF